MKYANSLKFLVVVKIFFKHKNFIPSSKFVFELYYCYPDFLRHVNDLQHSLQLVVI